ncbi:MAG: GNAT family N-acetyltransferase [Prevotella sp.]|nr:GNAT family N-acetyltransferase [Prevotella sp.]
MIEVRRYNPDDADRWNSFVAESKNGTFLLDRRYMDYHADRFTDYSLLFYLDDKLVALLPANVQGDILFSHGGLTYGGLVTTDKFKTVDALDVFTYLRKHLLLEGFERVIYKPCPWIYHSLPSEEDLYALFRFGARLAGRDVATVVDLHNMLPMTTLRRRQAKKALDNGVTISRENGFSKFWKVLDDNLMQRYGVHPVHTLDEISLLASRFPDIELYEAHLGGETIGGVVLYVCGKVAHVQYISANELGKKIGAIDLIFNRIIDAVKLRCRYLDFGKSTEQFGYFLNKGLIFQKEGFGGRAVCYDTYEWTL